MDAPPDPSPRMADRLRSAEHRAIAVAALLALLVLAGGFALLRPAATGNAPAANAVTAAKAPPPVEPVLLRDVAPETAREINAAVPFAAVANPPAPPFRLDPAAAGFNRAVDCLAAAGYYEAGDDAEGQRSVLQVVLNRVRHPAFPKSVCGVVFQGAERVTGCQFTFTCDGALRRVPSAAAWSRAREVARQALTGSVYGKVGLATHYHTDWVVPYWSASLVKLTAVKTHLFFRWPSSWGGPGALRGGYAGAEPGIARLAFVSPVHAAGVSEAELAALATAQAVPAPGAPFNLAATGIQKILFQSDEAFLVLLKPGAAPDALPVAARGLCGERASCTVRAWRDPARAPAQLPVSESQRSAMAFSYRRDTAASFDKPLWNCGDYPRANPRECMKQAVSMERVAAAATGGTLTRVEPEDEPPPRTVTAEPATPVVAETQTARRRPGS